MNREIKSRFLTSQIKSLLSLYSIKEIAEELSKQNTYDCYSCPSCGSDNLDIETVGLNKNNLECNECGYEHIQHTIPIPFESENTIHNQI